MNLAELIRVFSEGVSCSPGVGSATVDLSTVEITGVQHDSRAVVAGDLFCCVPGATADGHLHAADAVADGAVALLCERSLDLPVPQLIVPTVRPIMGPIASLVYGCPSRVMPVIGVTGTNGKTTTVFMIDAVLRAGGLVTGMSGTVETRVAGRSLPSVRTTPEAPALHSLLAEMKRGGAQAVAMEVSSHALDQHRVGGISFAVAAFSNLTQDHLDYHSSMEEYFKAKAKLFRAGCSCVGVVNVMDGYGRRLAESAEIPIITYAVEPRSATRTSADTDAGVDVDADIVATDVRPGPVSLAFSLRGPWGSLPIELGVGGTFNVANATCAAAIAVALGHESQPWPLHLSPEEIQHGFASMMSVPGRFEAIDLGQDFSVLVDYAHTPDGVKNLLSAARDLLPAGRRLCCVIGCGGDRDRQKRPLMGEAAASLADHVVVTSDNPRSERPENIINDILPGVRKGGASFVVVSDRRLAIRDAFVHANPGDFVVIAGKGHEAGQIVGGVVHPFDDRVVAREELGRLQRRDDSARGEGSV